MIKNKNKIFQKLLLDFIGIRCTHLRVSKLRAARPQNRVQFPKYIIFVITAFLLTSCASYKSTWDCPKVRGIGCSSVEYADYAARDQILANKGITQEKPCSECDENKEK